MDEIEKAAEEHVRSLYGEYRHYDRIDKIRVSSFKAGALYWKERSDREIDELKAEIERLKKERDEFIEFGKAILIESEVDKKIAKSRGEFIDYIIDKLK